MTKWPALTIASLGLSIMLVGGIAACKQQVGERCQVDDDCENGLVCNQGVEPAICDETGGGVLIDALPPPDTTPG